jgi:hypothetical protein
MSGPWEQYQTAEDGPWTQYEQPRQRGVVDKLLGLSGERYQTWPEKLARDVLGTPQNLMDAAASAPPGTREFTENVVPAATQAAAVASPVNPAIRAGDRLIPGMAQALRPEKPRVPTAQELKAIGVSDINAAKNSGLELTGASIADYSRKLQQELFDSGVHPTLAGNTFKILKELEDVPAGATFTGANLQTLRETFSAIAQNFNQNAAKDQLAASRVIKGLDQFLPNVNPSSVVAGNPAATQKLFDTGRGNFAAAQRSNDITGTLDRATTGILERAENRAQAANSGRNLDNTIRSKVASVLEKPKEVSGLSDAEIAALEGVVQGGKGRNAARTVGNWMGGGGGLGQTSLGALLGGGGYMVGGPVGAVALGSLPFFVGTGARSVANSLAKRDLRGVDELLRTRSPLYEQLMATRGMGVISPERRAAPMRGLLSMFE